MRKLLIVLAFALCMGLRCKSQAQALVPQIVYSASADGQTGTDNRGVVYTTPSDGMYRLNGVVRQNGCAVTINFSWTTVDGNNTPSLSSAPFLVYIPAGIDISLSFYNNPSCTYYAFANIEKIG